MKEQELRKTPRQIASQEKKKRIFDVSLELFQKFGYDAVTISDISEKSGMTKGSIYNFFGSKSGILANLSEQIRESTYEMIQPSEAHLADPKATILAYFMEQGQFFEQLGWELTQEYYLTSHPSQSERVGATRSNESVIASFSPDLIAFIEEVQNAGRCQKKDSAEAITASLLILCNGLVCTWSLSRGRFRLLETAEAAFRRQLEEFGF